MYETDQEQIEAIKSWWNQNGNWVIGGFLVFILTFVGYHWYQNATKEHRLEASAAYEQLLLNLTSDSANVEQRQNLTSMLKADYKDLGYATLAALIEAKAAVDAGDLDGAMTELEWAEANGSSELSSVVLYRKALVQFAQDNLDAALTSLNGIEGEGHQAVTFELKGDILLAQGKKDEARAAYQAAVDLSGDQGINNPYLQIKLDDLAVAE